MSGFRSIPLLLLLLLVGTALPAVVLPRPPSSPNYIPREYAPALVQGVAASKDYGEKVTYPQSTNVEKPDTQDFRFLEIELRDGDNVESLDLHGLVQAVLNTQQQQLGSSLTGQHFALSTGDVQVEDQELAGNLTYPHPEVVPHSIFGVRDVGLGPNQRVFEPSSLETRQQYLLGSSQPTKNLGDEKLYYLKSSRPKVYVNFRSRTGNFRQDGLDSRATMKLEPAAFLRATQPYRFEKKTKSSKHPPKKYDPRIHGTASESASISRTSSTATTTTTENTMVTSSELPKQIPAPPSKQASRIPIAHTTPVQRFTARRTDILPGYAFAEP